ncbi:uncharacterized protein FOMMEDRAFT_98993, partial [Fomitiporia mediterranea MF3/22]
DEAQKSMDTLKEAVLHCPTLTPINYESEYLVVLVVDLFIIRVGWYISQEHLDHKQRINQFGSINWNVMQAQYLQAKIELFGLYYTLYTLHIYLISVKKLIVKMDTSYIKGMINKPDLQPNATINCWIASILLFNFEFCHIPASDFKCTDRLL